MVSVQGKLCLTFLAYRLQDPSSSYYLQKPLSRLQALREAVWIELSSSPTVP